MTVFHTDHYFRIGHFHAVAGKPCQDYAVSGVVGRAAYAVVSDGCSSGGDTDVGARLLALGTAHSLREHCKGAGVSKDTTYQLISSAIGARAEEIVSAASALLDIQEKDMLATRLYTYLSPSLGFIHIEGDGVVALEYTDGRLELYRFEWDDNMPFYPAYRGETLRQFIYAHEHSTANPLRFSEERWMYAHDGSVISNHMQKLSVASGVSGVLIPVSDSPEALRAITCIAVFSDGVSQIENVDWKDAVKEFLAYKSVGGEFVKRRMMRGIKEMLPHGRGPLDDISVAVIRIESSEKIETDGDRK